MAISRRHGQIARITDHPLRVLVAHGKLEERELARAGLTTEDIYALLRRRCTTDIAQVGYLLYETKGVTTLIDAASQPGPVMRDGLAAAGYDARVRPPQQH